MSYDPSYVLALALGEMGLSSNDLNGLGPAAMKELFQEKVRTGRNDGRTEYERALDSVMVTLAGRQHLVKLRPYKEDFAWRKRLGELISRYVDTVKNDIDLESFEASETTELLKAFLPKLFSEAMDDLIDLMLAYAPELKDDAETASTAELAAASIRVFELGLPFFYAAVNGFMRLVPKSAKQSSSPASRK